VEGAQHPADGARDEDLRLDLVDIARLDGAEGGREYPVVLGDLVRRGERAPAEKTGGTRRGDDREKDGRQRATAAHQPSIVTDKLPMSNDFWPRPVARTLDPTPQGFL